MSNANCVSLVQTRVVGQLMFHHCFKVRNVDKSSLVGLELDIISLSEINIADNNLGTFTEGE